MTFIRLKPNSLVFLKLTVDGGMKAMSNYRALRPPSSDPIFSNHISIANGSFVDSDCMWYFAVSLKKSVEFLS